MIVGGIVRAVVVVLSVRVAIRYPAGLLHNYDRLCVSVALLVASALHVPQKSGNDLGECCKERNWSDYGF